MSEFAELAARSCFSFLEGASHPEELVTRAKELDLHALGLCDRDGLYGSVRAHAEAKKLGQRLLVGAELTLEIEPISERSARGKVPIGAPRLSVLVEDHAGYEALCHHLTVAHADHDKGEAALSPEELAARPEGLFALLPIHSPQDAEAPWITPLREAFGERFAFIAYRAFDGRDGERTLAVKQAAARFDAPIVASGRPLYHRPEQKPLADILHCIRHKTTLDRAGKSLSPNAEAFLRSPAQMFSIFRDHPEWVRATVPIAERARFSLSELRYHFPSDSMLRLRDDGRLETPDEALRRATDEGARARYPEGVPANVAQQLEKELTLIARIGVAPYFLSVQEIVQIAREKRILCQGRGSAANSAVCFVLGVTAVDPSRSNLLFERFLSEERAEPPDIDVDFEHERREEVIQALYARYGRARAAMVSEIIAYRGRSALREVGKVLGLSPEALGKLAAVVTHYALAELSTERIAELGLDLADARLRLTLELAKKLEGYPRHLSIHVGGFVLSAEPLTRVAPVEPARMPGRTVIPWDKDDLDTLGFFKVDVLALGMLTAIRKTLERVHANEPAIQAVDASSSELEPFDPIDALARIPAEDPVVYDAICKADTVGVFQIESRAQMSMLPRLRPRRFYDLVIEVAIVRPGPIQGGMVHPYLRRRTGEEPATPPHPCLDGILRRTLGVPLFQEQVMQIAMVGAGYTAGEADQLRRDMASWRRHGRLERHRDKLLAGFAERGITRAFGEKLYQQVQGFGEYGFPESHAASFALLVYASSWLKVHHPAAFACALLNSQPMGFYSPSSIVRDAQRHGVTVRPVSVVTSAWDATLERDLLPAKGAASLPPAERDGALRLGLRIVKGFAEKSGEAIVRAREEAPFRDTFDLAHRAGLERREVELLAEAGALEGLTAGRREALWQARAPREGGLFEGVRVEAPRRLGLPPLGPVEQLVLDYERTGLCLDDHPLRHLRPRLKKRGAVPAEALARLRNGQEVRVAGLVLGRQRPETASGVTFVTLEDETGIANLIVQRHVWDEHHLTLRHAPMLLVWGKLERQGEVIHVLVQRAERIELSLRGDDGNTPVPAGEGAVTSRLVRSRDFH